MYIIAIVLLVICIVFLLIYIHFFLRQCQKIVDPRVQVIDNNPVVEIVQPIATRQTLQNRDAQVVYNPLYPPLNRNSTDLTRQFINEPRLQPSRENSDMYRLVGYLVNNENQDKSWKLFAREKLRNQYEYYVAPSDKTQDIKIFLNTEFVKPPLRDLNNLPDSVNVNHPLFDKEPYTVIKLPLSDFSSEYF